MLCEHFFTGIEKNYPGIVAFCSFRPICEQRQETKPPFSKTILFFGQIGLLQSLDNWITGKQGSTRMHDNFMDWEPLLNEMEKVIIQYYNKLKKLIL